MYPDAPPNTACAKKFNKISFIIFLELLIIVDYITLLKKCKYALNVSLLSAQNRHNSPNIKIILIYHVN
ncbi:hypothetical protein DSECCO2_531380 [anaerobic digester metagenome]